MLTTLFAYIVNIIIFASGIVLPIIPLICVGIIIIIINMAKSYVNHYCYTPHLLGE